MIKSLILALCVITPLISAMEPEDRKSALMQSIPLSNNSGVEVVYFCANITTLFHEYGKAQQVLPHLDKSKQPHDASDATLLVPGRCPSLPSDAKDPDIDWLNVNRTGYTFAHTSLAQTKASEPSKELLESIYEHEAVQLSPAEPEKHWWQSTRK